jgi:integrase/recombinase XerD
MCFDPVTLKIDQSPRHGVQTKFGKPFTSRVIRFDDKLVEYVLEWVNYLRTVKLFGDTAPLFPRSKVVQATDSLSFECHEVEPVFWTNAGPVRKILKDRTVRAGLPYYRPHAYRHAAIRLASRRCCTAEQLKAISQNFGHENIGTTLLTYGRVDSGRVDEVLEMIDFSSDSEQAKRDEQIDIIMQELRKLKGTR